MHVDNFGRSEGGVTKCTRSFPPIRPIVSPLAPCRAVVSGCVTKCTWITTSVHSPDPSRGARSMTRPESPSTMTNPTAISATPTLISDRQLRLVEAGEQIELNPGEISFSARLWAQLSLPYRDPGDLPRWSRQNGSITVTVTPGPAGYAFGVVARYLLIWMSTEAVRTQDRHLNPGQSLNAFLRALGMNTSGASARRVADQLHRLATCSITVEDTRVTEQTRRVSGANIHVASRYELVFPRAAEAQATTASIVLSEDYFADVIAAPVPVYTAALKALSGSPLRMDLYVWLAYRMATLRGPVTITWAQLAGQFGGEYAQLRQFKAKLIKHLDAVRVVYPRARVAVTDAGLRLHPSATHVARKRKKALRRSA